MKTKVCISVDVEPSIAGAFSNPGLKPMLHEPVYGVVNGKSEALGFMIETLRKYGVSATFFIEVLHTKYFIHDEMKRYTDMLLEYEQDCQLHIHPLWNRFITSGERDYSTISDHCNELDVELLTDLIVEGVDILQRWTGCQVDSMRTGNFSTAKNVFTAMKNAGMKYSSNICAGIFVPPDISDPPANGCHLIDGITELPVTCFVDRGPIGRGKLRPLQITACSFTEMVHILEQGYREGISAIMIVTHPFEYIKYDDFRFSNMRANRLVQNRFAKLCEYLANNSERFEICTIGQLARQDHTYGDTRTLYGNVMDSITRSIQNYINDRFF